MHHSDFVAMIAKIYKPNTYLELGIYYGETWYKVQPYCKYAIGVDIVDHGIGGEIFIESTKSFFSHFDKPIDMAFIDADHSAQSVLCDFTECMQRLNKGGVILLHDTDPAKKELIHPGYCGDAYKVVESLEIESVFNIVTLPIAEAGLSIVTKKGVKRVDLP
jgi:hypothetical protein